MKTRIFLALLIASIFVGCSEEPSSSLKQLIGYAQGTTYTIKYITNDNLLLDKQVDSVFKAMDASMSTYQDNSLISQWNKGATPMKLGEDFFNVLLASVEVAKETNGLFDPTVAPLVQAWGFGKKSATEMDSTMIQNLLQTIGYEKVLLFGDSSVGKMIPELQLDFNAIAQGYTVDKLEELLKSYRLKDYMIEVGGEVICKGKNANGETWKIGIDKPSEEIQNERFQAIIQLPNKALATSGNYRKFRVDEKTGIKYSHTIHPKTGYPVNHSLLSATVIGPNCMYADAYATAFMVMGLNESIEFLKSHPDWDAYFVYSNENGDWETYATDGFKQIIL